MASPMDQLTASLGAHCDVAANPFDINRPHPRYADYSSLREPASLLGDQNKRRAEFLERQKSKREKLVNLQRRLLDESGIVTDGEDDSKQLGKREEEKSAKTSELSRSKWTFANQLMMSEWLVDVPPDLEENWLAKPCPKGRRMLVVAHKGITKAYSKAGHVEASFSSALPSGNSSSPQGMTILDCVWNRENRTYYVLDVLAWKNIVLLDCETEFRFYWLKTKLDEHPEARCNTEKNRNAFLPLPSCECKEEPLTALMSSNPMFFDEKDPGLDGILFYHKSNLYEHGSTPLVTWIKPFMMEDVLGIKVHQGFLDEKPPGYCNQAAYIRDFEQAAEARKASNRGRKWFHRKGKSTRGQTEGGNKMDCTDESSDSKMEEEVK